MRASDRDRDRAAARLAAGYAEGSLSADTLTSRVARAYAARTRSELSGLIRDLPGRGRLRALTARLAHLAGGSRTLELPFPPTGEASTIGRHAGCALVLDDPTVSRRHASLRFDGDRWLVRDLGSMNGTRVNGWRVEESPVAPGDTVRFGETVVRFAGD